MPLQDFDFSQSYAFIERDEKVLCVYGKVQLLQTLHELEALHQTSSDPLIFLNPYSSIVEKGYECTEPRLPIRALVPERYLEISRDDLLSYLPKEKLSFQGDLQTSLDDQSFAEIIGKVQEQQIKGGNAVQVLLSRNFSGNIADFEETKLQSLFAHLLARRGQYMTFLLVDRSEQCPRYFVGASIEKHLEVTKDTVSMVPICGTFRKNGEKDLNVRSQKLIDFLRDQKEIDELTQVMEEEFKMMAFLCPEGGEIHGPLLRESGSVIHTEYHLEGERASLAVVPLLRHSLHAPTLVGGPIESANRIIAQYETEPRRYYGGQVGVLYHEEMKEAQPQGKVSCLDSAILIRSAEIDHRGHLTVRAGGTITKDSDPLSEAKETRAKADSLLRLFGAHQFCDESMLDQSLLSQLQPILQERNKELSQFHIMPHGGDIIREALLKDLRIAIIDNEDHFADVKAFMLRLMGAKVEVIDTFEVENIDALARENDIIILGPGPGDVNDLKNPRISRLHDMIKQLQKTQTKMLGICLGHQALCLKEGYNVRRLEEITQGVQQEINLFGSKEKVGFYNSFMPFDGDTPVMTHQGDHCLSVQFHPESVMTQNGFMILQELVMALHQGRSPQLSAN